MPDLGVTEILAIAGLVAGAAGTGVSVYEGQKSRDTQADAAKAAQQTAAQQQLLQKRESIAAAAPNAQAQTGGSLTGEGSQSFADILAGYAGQTGGAGTTGGSSNAATASAATNATGAPGGGLEDLLKQLGGGGGTPQGNAFFGGSGQPQQSDPRFSLANGY